MILATLKELLGFGLFGGQRWEAARSEDIEAAWSSAQADVSASGAPVYGYTPEKTEIIRDSPSGPQDKALPQCSCGRGGRPTYSMISGGTSPELVTTDETSHQEATADDASGSTAVASEEEPADDDARREAIYSVFDGEDENDYTVGPLRIVEASDGAKADCGALLLNLDLSQKIKLAIEAENELSEANLRARAQDQECTDFEQELKSRIEGHEYGLALAEQEAEQNDEKMAEVQALNAELEKLNLLLEESVAEREEIHANINDKVERYLMTHAEVNAYLREAFIVANLLPPAMQLEKPQPVPRDVEEEYKKLCERMEMEPADNDDYMLQSFDDHFKPKPLSDEEQKDKYLQDAYDEAKCSLRDAQTQFDRRELFRENDRRQNEWTLQQSHGAEGMPWEEFDVLWVQKISEFTRELIDAEAAFAAARKAATEAGVVIEDADQSSEFGDEDGVYPPSVDEQLIAFVPRDRVEAWLADIPSPAGDFEAALSDVDVDEWNAEEVGVGDSYSTVAQPEGKRKIRKWQEACRNGAAE